MSNATDFQSGRTTNNNFSSSGNDGQSLQQRKRWQRTSPNLQAGDLVLTREDKMTPLHSPTAVIMETHPRNDGNARVVTLRTLKGTFKRPTTKLFPPPHVNSEL